MGKSFPIIDSEVLPFINKKKLYLLQLADNCLLRKFYNCPKSTPIETMFLEGGKLPIEYIISKRRLMYLWHLLHCSENDLIRKVYNIQMLKFTKNDFYTIIQREKVKYSINYTDQEIMNMSKHKFKCIVNNCVDKFINSYKKDNLSMQDYLRIYELTKE